MPFVEFIAIACIVVGLSEVISALCIATQRHIIERDVDIISMPINIVDGTCPICLDDFADTPKRKKRLTTCGHLFCAECFELWFEQHPRCPLCNFEFS